MLRRRGSQTAKATEGILGSRGAHGAMSTGKDVVVARAYPSGRSGRRTGANGVLAGLEFRSLAPRPILSGRRPGPIRALVRRVDSHRDGAGRCLVLSQR